MGRRENPELKSRRRLQFGLILVLSLGLGVAGELAAAQMTTVRVLVKDAPTGEPIYQARLTLSYRQAPRVLRRSHIISYTSKTDMKGFAKFPYVQMGKIALIVTAPDHETFGKEFEIKKENQLIEVQLKKPQPVL